MPDKVKTNSQVYHSYWSSIPAELRKVTDSTTPTKSTLALHLQLGKQNLNWALKKTHYPWATWQTAVLS